MTDPFDLGRFLKAQAPIYQQVRSELGRGKKTSHWMWFVFPQIAGLGQSAMAVKYAIQSIEEATAYLAHPELGARLRECTELLLNVQGRSLQDIFGSPDDMKLRSCMTLFTKASGDTRIFAQALAKYCAGAEDLRTIRLLAEQRAART